MRIHKYSGVAKLYFQNGSDNNLKFIEFRTDSQMAKSF